MTFQRSGRTCQDMEKRLLNINEAATILGVTPGRLYQMVHRRTIPFVKIGKSLRFDKRRLEKFIETNSREVIDYDYRGINVINRNQISLFDHDPYVKEEKEQ